MQLILVVVVLVLVICAMGLLIWLITAYSAGRNQLTGQTSSINLLQQQLDALKAAQAQTCEHLQSSLHTSQVGMTQNLQSSQHLLAQLNARIGELHGTNKQMLQLAGEVRRLQDILSSPKLRGQMGERSLENLLSQILPVATYKLQYAFSDGKIVDALVQLDDFSVPIDAKFPLPSFERVAQGTTDQEKASLRKQFLKDVTAHIDTIASSYIRPAEGTLDFAIMYIPAENVYYETIVRYTEQERDVLDIALDKKVIPVSPNLLYAYLMTVVMGLHGLQIEKQAAEIRQNLKKLNADFAQFVSSWDTLGSHIRNTFNKYDQAGQNLNRFAAALERTQGEPDV